MFVSLGHFTHIHIHIRIWQQDLLIHHGEENKYTKLEASCYIVLGPKCVLHGKEGCDKKVGCSLREWHYDSDEDEEGAFAAHMFHGGDCSLQDHIKDVVGHMQHLFAEVSTCLFLLP